MYLCGAAIDLSVAAFLIYSLYLFGDLYAAIDRPGGKSVPCYRRKCEACDYESAVTLGAFLQIVCLTIILGVTVIGFVFLFNGMIGVYVNLITRCLLEKRDTENMVTDEGRMAF